MKTVYSEAHRGHSGHGELVAGAIVPGFEKPERAEIIRARIDEVDLGPVVPPAAQTLATAHKLHDAAYLAFLPQVWALWRAEGRHGPAMPFAWPVPGLRRDVEPERIDARLGFHSFDGGASFVAGTWTAIRAAHDVALTAADLVADGAPAAFALGRPPGHHAGARFMGGYCYINNAALAAERLRERGAARVAVLDIDYHHGNGTQDIFYARDDVVFVSIHGDPKTEFPFFLGHADETGTGAGAGFTRNLPLPAGTGWEAWADALDAACDEVARHRPDALVVSLGVDTFAGDPISRFRLDSAHFPRIGRRLARLGLPTVFVMEGGYAVEAIGVNAVGVLAGFEE
ncbi:histone deacetylase family protein [Aquibium sp. A9E412]|uniref:histone deacetylase family protein n=1 Tax=Aquibium sp. A9E412 TaxID=2976767 RepID=UPI0025B27E20|nr:histone deacetylase family protein [Aquibium sp. A9E412]MDN2566456.1 histone deacetylase family protein [Aquibium sp. A9E412]